MSLIMGSTALTAIIKASRPSVTNIGPLNETVSPRRISMSAESLRLHPSKYASTTDWVVINYLHDLPINSRAALTRNLHSSSLCGDGREVPAVTEHFSRLRIWIRGSPQIEKL